MVACCQPCHTYCICTRILSQHTVRFFIITLFLKFIFVYLVTFFFYACRFCVLGLYIINYLLNTISVFYLPFFAILLPTLIRSNNGCDYFKTPFLTNILIIYITFWRFSFSCHLIFIFPFRLFFTLRCITIRFQNTMFSLY